MSTTTGPNCDALLDTFRVWDSERESLDNQLRESVEALVAYQSHLDGWQENLAQERSELQSWRDQLERDREALAELQGEVSAEAAAELEADREKITALTTNLLDRTEELRISNQRRAEVVTELELSRVREADLRTTLDEHKHTAEQERAQWADEFRRLRELLERQLESPAGEEQPVAVERPASAAPPQRPAPVGVTRPNDSPVLGSIVEQFGKLRQQRAIDRQALKRPR